MFGVVCIRWLGSLCLGEFGSIDVVLCVVLCADIWLFGEAGGGGGSVYLQVRL